jgi:hypothetical protein
MTKAEVKALLARVSETMDRANVAFRALSELTLSLAADLGAVRIDLGSGVAETVGAAALSHREMSGLALELAVSLNQTIRLIDEIALELHKLSERLKAANAALESQGLGPF